MGSSIHTTRKSVGQDGNIDQLVPKSWSFHCCNRVTVHSMKRQWPSKSKNNIRSAEFIQYPALIQLAIVDRLKLLWLSIRISINHMCVYLYYFMPQTKVTLDEYLSHLQCVKLQAPSERGTVPCDHSIRSYCLQCLELKVSRKHRTGFQTNITSSCVLTLRSIN